ncbi:unnamed protein product [Diamesa serratosioi]
MDINNVNNEKTNSPDEELEWDEIDHDEVLKNLNIKKEKEQKLLAKQQIVYQSKTNDEDGNYFDNQQSKKNEKQQNQNKQSSSGKGQDNYVQLFSHKDLIRIKNFTNSSSTFHHLLYETYGHFDKFISTHDQEGIPHENIVELLNIDAALLSIPFDSHNNFLLKGICASSAFWSQLLLFLREFMESKHHNLTFLIQVDMKTFFVNLEIIFHKILLNDLLNSSMEKVFQEVVAILEDNINVTEWSKPGRFLDIKTEYENNKNVFQIYDIYPTLKDINCTEESMFLANIIDGEYSNISHYLQVNLPLLKEDFLSRFRDGINEFKKMETVRRNTITNNIVIYPEAKITVHNRLIHETKCQLITAEFKISRIDNIDFHKRFFNGQLLCFTTSKEFTDLVVAIVNNCDPKELKKGIVSIELIRTENTGNIFEQDFFMLEATALFEPYFRVFNVLKNLNESNFPFADQILKVKDVDKFPEYLNRINDVYNYKNHNFNIKNITEWPSHKKLHLKQMQLKAVHKAITSKFTTIQGPPGTGKTFVGLEILNILLNNTSETILIITQTNHALDKFLLGAMEFTDNIVRLGRQSKCEKLEQFTIKINSPLESKHYYEKLQYDYRQEVGKFSTAKTEEEFNRIRENISRLSKMIEELNQLSAFCSINKKRIIGMTTSYAAKGNAVVKMINAGIVIVEESSEVLESHIVASLTKQTKQLIMIGDYLQLRPLTNSYELTKKYHFNISLFERLMRNKSNFVTLDVQLRMSTEICNLVRSTIYPELKDCCNIDSYPKVKGTEQSLFCFNHKFPESEHGGVTSKENKTEVEFIVKLCVYLVAAGNDTNDITILTVYAAQAEKIKYRLKKCPTLKSTINVAVLDAYQGEENKIILLSLVRSNDRNEIGFLNLNNRISVILSRAKYGFFIIANMDCLAKNKTWKKVYKILKSQNAIADYFPINYNNDILKIKTPEEFPAI